MKRQKLDDFIVENKLYENRLCKWILLCKKYRGDRNNELNKILGITGKKFYFNECAGFAHNSIIYSSAEAEKDECYLFILNGVLFDKDLKKYPIENDELWPWAAHNRAPPVVPKDMVIKILSYIPVADAVKYRFVCKNWARYIKSDEFWYPIVSKIMDIGSFHSEAWDWLTREFPPLNCHFTTIWFSRLQLQMQKLIVKLTFGSDGKNIQTINYTRIGGVNLFIVKFKNDIYPDAEIRIKIASARVYIKWGEYTMRNCQGMSLSKFMIPFKALVRIRSEEKSIYRQFLKALT